MYITIYVYYYYYLYYNSKNTGGRGYRGREGGEGEERRHGGRSGHSPTHVLDRSPSAVLACPPFSPCQLFSPVHHSEFSSAHLIHPPSSLAVLSCLVSRHPLPWVCSNLSAVPGSRLPPAVLACRSLSSRLSPRFTSTSPVASPVPSRVLRAGR